MRNQVLIDAVPAPRAARPGRWSAFVAPVLGVYVLSRLLVFGVILDSRGGTVTKLARIADGQYYLQIAAHGYPKVLAPHAYVAAFFPLYPLVLRGVAPIVGGDWVATSVVVSFLTGALACLAVGALARERGGDEIGVRAGWLMALAPGAAFLSPAYAEGLAISLCALALVMLGRRRWLLAGVVGAFATAASPLSLPIVVAAAWAAWRSEQRHAWVAPVLASSGFASYCLYLWAHMGTPFGWFDAERLGWPGQGFDLLAPLHWLTTWSGITVVETLCMVLAFGGVWALSRAKVPGTWWAFTVVFLASVIFSGGLWLTPRLLLSAFPLVAAAAIALDAKRFRVVLVSSAVVMVLVLLAYTQLVGFVYQP